jgi:hypothetical protein
MDSTRAFKLTFVLSIIASALALAAALIRYVSHGEINISLIAAAIFVIAFGLAARSRTT